MQSVLIEIAFCRPAEQPRAEPTIPANLFDFSDASSLTSMEDDDAEPAGSNQYGVQNGQSAAEASTSHAVASDRGQSAGSDAISGAASAPGSPPLTGINAGVEFRVGIGLISREDADRAYAARGFYRDGKAPSGNGPLHREGTAVSDGDPPDIAEWTTQTTHGFNDDLPGPEEEEVGDPADTSSVPGQANGNGAAKVDIEHGHADTSRPPSPSSGSALPSSFVHLLSAAGMGQGVEPSADASPNGKMKMLASVSSPPRSSQGSSVIRTRSKSPLPAGPGVSSASTPASTPTVGKIKLKFKPPSSGDTGVKAPAVTSDAPPVNGAAETAAAAVAAETALVQKNGVGTASAAADQKDQNGDTTMS